MSKRSPELETLVDSRSGGRVYHTEKTDAAIRSLRVKLCRERARAHILQSNRFAFVMWRYDPGCEKAIESDNKRARHLRIAKRLRSLADKIERGEL